MELTREIAEKALEEANNHVSDVVIPRVREV